MRDAIHRVRPARRAWTVLALGLLLTGAGCQLGGQTEPGLSGPSDQGYNVSLIAAPDIVNADGVSTSVVRLVLLDQNGAPVNGLAVNFVLEAGDGTMLPAAGATYVGPIQTGIVMATDRSGVTSVLYTAGTNFVTVRISVRPYGIDAANGFYRSVEIFQQ